MNKNYFKRKCEKLGLSVEEYKTGSSLEIIIETPLNLMFQGTNTTCLCTTFYSDFDLARDEAFNDVLKTCH
jgi:hypothetical protein